jgi:hypothetical protein
LAANAEVAAKGRDRKVQFDRSGISLPCTPCRQIRRKPPRQERTNSSGPNDDPGQENDIRQSSPAKGPVANHHCCEAIDTYSGADHGLGELQPRRIPNGK